MDPVNWLAVIVSPLVAVAIGFVWYGPLFGGARPFSARTALGALALQGVSVLMLGHAFARIGAAKLAVKPWLFWMQSGGIALAFIIPALWLSYARLSSAGPSSASLAVSRRDALIDAGYWLAAYLAMGTVFWALR